MQKNKKQSSPDPKVAKPSQAKPSKGRAASVKASPKTKKVTPTPKKGSAIVKIDNGELGAQLMRANEAMKALDYQTASTIYQSLLTNNPQDPLLLRQHGVLKLQSQDNIAAQQLLNQSLGFAPQDPVTQKFLGLAHLRLSEYKLAIELLSDAEKQLPLDSDVRYFSAQALGGLKQFDEAVKKILSALAQKPDQPTYLHTLGILLSQAGADKRALTALYRALDLAPTLWNARLTLAHVLMRLNRHKEAISHYAEVLRDAPEKLEVVTNLGIAYMATEELEAAETQFQKLLTLFPKEAEPHHNLANLYSKNNRYEEALEKYQDALRFKSNYPEAWNNYGITLRRLNRVEESLDCFERAIEQRANFPDAHWNRSLSLLLLGRLKEGFEEYEWRWRGAVKELRPRKLAAPEWQMSTSLKGKRILVHSEQGLGDHIQFMRYLPILESMGATVIAEFPEPLLPLCKKFAPTITWVQRGAHQFPPYDFFCPLLSLAQKLGTEIQTIPRSPSYLLTPAELGAPFESAIKTAKGLKIGITWAGNPKHQNDQNRSIPLENLLSALPNIPMTLVSLMKEPPARDIECLKANPAILEFSKQLDTFAHTAALISQLDLVITVDTSIAHLAGALGKPVWNMLPFAPDWRWMLGKNDTPWYPSMTLYRQDQPHHWESVFKEIHEDLIKMAR